MTALPNTDTLDIPARGLPTIYIINLNSGPNIETDLLDTPSRGLPTEYLQPLNTIIAVAGGGGSLAMQSLRNIQHIMSL